MWMLEYIVASPVTFLGTILLVVLTWHYLWMLNRRKGLPPGPASLPIIGNIYVAPQDGSEVPFAVAKLSEKYGHIFTMQTPGGSCMVLITDPQIAREAFATNTDVAGRPFGVARPTTMKILNPFFPKAGVIFSDYDEQLVLQRNTSMVVLRSLGYGKKSIENKIIEEADHLIKAFKETYGKSFNPAGLLSNAVANIICSLLFDERYDYQDEHFQAFQKCMADALHLMQQLLVLDYVWFYRYLPSGRRQLKAFKLTADAINEFTTKQIEQVKQSMKSGEKVQNFISLYLREVEKSNGKIDDRSHQLVKDFFGAGTETTSNTLGWCLYFMAKHPQIQENVRNELNKTIGSGLKPTLQDREKLPYVEATLTEILRLAPVADGSIPHYTIRDTTIRGYKIPKGTTVQTLFASTIWNETLFPEPHLLKPERHLNSEGKFIKNANLTPFGVGRRSCLGEQLAKQELFLFFTHLIQSFEFKVPEGETLPPQKGILHVTYRPPAYNITAKQLT